MRIEIVQHDANHRGFGVAFIHQPLHRVGEVALRPLRRHLHMPPASLRCHKEKEVARAVARIFVIIALRLARLGRQRLPRLLNELLGGLIKVYLGPGRINTSDIF